MTTRNLSAVVEIPGGAAEAAEAGDGDGCGHVETLSLALVGKVTS